MNRSKKINITCYTPHWKYPDLNVAWNDIWIDYFKGRKKIKESLTFIWAGDIDSQIKQTEENNAYMRKVTLEQSKNKTAIVVRSKGEEKEYDSFDEWLGLSFTLEEQLDLYKNENTDWLDLQWMKEYFKDYNKDFGIMNCSHDTQSGFEPMNDGYFYIMVNRPTLNKKDFEDGLEWYLKTIQNVGNVNLNFNWNRTKMWVLPM